MKDKLRDKNGSPRKGSEKSPVLWNARAWYTGGTEKQISTGGPQARGRVHKGRVEGHMGLITLGQGGWSRDGAFNWLTDLLRYWVGIKSRTFTLRHNPALFNFFLRQGFVKLLG